MDLLQIKLNTFISRIDSPFSINEVCGYLTGFAVSNKPVDSYFPALEMFFSDVSKPEKNQPDYKIVTDNIVFIKQSVDNGLPIFPFNDEDDFQFKLMALGEWSKSFILSINFLIQKKLLKNTLDYQEILHDLTEISKVGHNYDINDTDDIDKYYQEISAYVLSAVSHIYSVSKEDSSHNDQ
ncbi:MAG: UPF0149 family protein [Gammaproteobacteria bacterium]|nr:UPF0149 family protein [Gammaproteobacteria bacterium]